MVLHQVKNRLKWKTYCRAVDGDTDAIWSRDRLTLRCSSSATVRRAQSSDSAVERARRFRAGGALRVGRREQGRRATYHGQRGGSSRMPGCSELASAARGRLLA